MTANEIRLALAIAAFPEFGLAPIRVQPDTEIRQGPHIFYGINTPSGPRIVWPDGTILSGQQDRTMANLALLNNLEEWLS